MSERQHAEVGGPSNSYIGENQTVTYERKVPWLAHGLVSVLIFVVAIAIIIALFSSKPEARRWGGDRSAPSVAVDISDITVEDFEVWVDSYGTAQPLTQTQLVPDVSARVIMVSENIRAGSSFKKGELLVQLDDRDLKVEVEVAASAAADAEFRYLQEVAESELAAQQWNKRPDSEAARLLALRKPQVAAAKAALNAANARFARAQLNLERTQIKAPFDGKVLRQMVDVGQVVSPSQAIAEIYSTDSIEVRLPVKIRDLEHIVIPEQSSRPIDAEYVQIEQPRVKLIGELGSQTFQWDAKIVRSEGAFDPSTRMLYLVAQIERPFENTVERPAVRVGQFFRAQIQGSTLKDVIVIPRRAVSQDYMVSIADEGFLRKRKITPLWTDAKSVVVAGEPSSNVSMQSSQFNTDRLALNSSDKLILTPTANLPDGTRVKPLNIQSDRPSKSSSDVISQTAQSAASASALK